MISFIIFGLFALFAIIVCGISLFKSNSSKLSFVISLKGYSIISILMLALASCNLSSSFSGTALFILLAIALVLFKEVVAVLPSKDNIFKNLENSLNIFACLSLVAGSLLITELSAFGLLAGIGVGIIACLIIALIKKQLKAKTFFVNYLPLMLLFAMIGQIVIIYLNPFSVQSIIFTIGLVLLFIQEIIKIIVKQPTSKKLEFVVSILLYLGLVCLACSIFASKF